MQGSIQERLTKQPTVEPVILLKVNQSDFISMWLAAEAVKNLDRRPPPSIIHYPFLSMAPPRFVFVVQKSEPRNISRGQHFVHGPVP